MHETIEAIYENGVFRPLHPPKGLPEHTHVTMRVDVGGATPSIAECIGIMPDKDAKEMAQIMDAEFEKVNPNEWK
jgi:predicted DNA-binding antitoxin AbrB/MazE fold protein